MFPFCFLPILKQEEIWVECKLAIAHVRTITGDQQSMRNYIVRSDGPKSNFAMRPEPDFSLLKWRMGEASCFFM